MKVDANYAPKGYDDWAAEDWPSTYESPAYPNVFAVGIAFAPPHQISRPRKSPNGTVVAPSPPRTGMPSGVMGKTAALTIVERITKGPQAHTHTAATRSHADTPRRWCSRRFIATRATATRRPRR